MRPVAVKVMPRSPHIDQKKAGGTMRKALPKDWNRAMEERERSHDELQCHGLRMLRMRRATVACIVT